MKSSKTIREIQLLKTIGDDRRLEVLRLLMDQPHTLTQLGDRLGVHPAKVRYHLKLLEKNGLVEFVSSKEIRGYVEKYYQATAKAYLINQIILPKFDGSQVVVTLGSHDPALELLAEHFKGSSQAPQVVTVPIGSLDGLIALRQRLCHFAGCHLFDPVADEYNLSYIRYFFPDQNAHVVTLAHRLQGLYIQQGNPESISSLNDLTRENITFVNRGIGSGTRLWLDQQIKKLDINPQDIHGYEISVNTHFSVAERILSGKAQVGLGVQAAAQKCGLGFIPLFIERFDLVFLDEAYYSKLLHPTLEYLQTANFRNEVEALGGYEAHDTGREIKIMKNDTWS